MKQSIVCRQALLAESRFTRDEKVKQNHHKL